MLNNINKEVGFTLVELLVSLLLGSILLTMMIGLYVNSISASAKALKFSRLRTDMQSIVALMENDIRRAGYGGADFMVGLEHTKVFDIINSETQKCIVYAYNYDFSASIKSSHFMAFRYSINAQALQFGRKVNAQATNCFNSGYWVNLTDPNFLKVTKLNFVESEALIGGMIKRSVDINIEAELTANDTYKYQVKSRIQARNVELVNKNIHNDIKQE